MTLINEYRKAIAALLVPPLALLGVALTDASDGGGAVTGPEWVNIAIAALLGTTAVALIPNEPQAGGKHELR